VAIYIFWVFTFIIFGGVAGTRTSKRNKNLSPSPIPTGVASRTRFVAYKKTSKSPIGRKKDGKGSTSKDLVIVEEATAQTSKSPTKKQASKSPSKRQQQGKASRPSASTPLAHTVDEVEIARSAAASAPLVDKVDEAPGLCRF